jgi:uncharacterized membrane protein
MRVLCRTGRHAANAPSVTASALCVVWSLACQRDEPPAASEPMATPSASAPLPGAGGAAAKPASAAAAPELALAHFRVHDVAAGDVLNIRSQPDANARSLGGIPAGAARVEGIGGAAASGSTRWQRVRHGGTIGWVNARFLVPDESAAREGAPALAASKESAVLVPLTCFGTEPFWGIRFAADGSASCEAMCEGPPGLRLANLRTSPSGEPQTFDLLGPDSAVYLRAAMLETGQCSDGMSDLLHPYEFEAVRITGALSGCCRVQKDAEREPRP